MSIVSLRETSQSSMAIRQLCHKGGAAYALSMSFGQRIKDRRADLKMTGDDLGRRLDPPVSKQTIAHWEAGRYRPHIDQVAQLCAILGLSADALVLGGEIGLSPRAAEIAAAYDRLQEGEKSRVELMLMAMGIEDVTNRKTVKTNREGIHASPLSNQPPTIGASGPVYGPALTKAFEAGKGVRNAGGQSGGASKPRSNKRS